MNTDTSNPSPALAGGARRVTCTFFPNQVMSVFYVPEVHIDGGKTRDPVDVACKFYLLWQTDYFAASGVCLDVEGEPEMSKILGKALFGRAAIAKATL